MVENNINWEEKFVNKLGLNENDYIKILSTINNISSKEDNENNKYIIKCISLDVPRTLPEEFRKQNPKFTSNLEEVLKVFSFSNGGLGYISGMSFIVKMLLKLTNNNKIKTYIVLRNIFENENIKDLYNDNYMNIYNKFKILFKEKLPSLFQHFENNKIDLLNFVYSKFKTLFTFTFDENIAEYIFKIFIYKNDFNINLDSLLVILKIYEMELLNINEYEILTFIYSIKTVDFNKFIENMKEYNK